MEKGRENVSPCPWCSRKIGDAVKGVLGGGSGQLRLPQEVLDFLRSGVVVSAIATTVMVPVLITASLAKFRTHLPFSFPPSWPAKNQEGSSPPVPTWRTKTPAGRASETIPFSVEWEFFGPDGPYSRYAPTLSFRLSYFPPLPTQ